MSTTADIKKNLILRIKDSKDINFLKALQTIFDATDQTLFQLTTEQQESIDISKAELNNGEAIDNEKVISEMKKWLQKK
ncbi:MAG TPA: hypothetical protein PKL31_18350 [Fulvivirga sp.]|nr:hypothetical protein [Fulvivirga sp.]